MAVLKETLRLYNPLLTCTKSTRDKRDTLTYHSRTLHIPANTTIFPNLNALGCHPRYWGEDGLVWRPSRWIQPAEDTPASPNSLPETLWTPPRGSFMPWAEGPRGRPGKKFGQVEFVAAMAALFRDNKVEIVRGEKEMAEMAGKGVQEMVDDSAMVLLMQMMKPESVALRWLRNT